MYRPNLRNYRILQIIEIAQKTYEKVNLKMICSLATSFDIPNQQSITFTAEILENSNRFDGFAQNQYPKSLDDCLMRISELNSNFIPSCSLSKTKSQNDIFLTNNVNCPDRTDEACRNQMCPQNPKSSKSLTNSIYQSNHFPSVIKSLSISADQNFESIPRNQCEGCLKWKQFAKEQKLTMLQLQKTLIEKQHALYSLFKDLTIELETKTKQNQKYQRMLQQLKASNEKNISLLNVYKNDIQIVLRKARKQAHCQRKNLVNTNKDKNLENQELRHGKKVVNLNVFKNDGISPWQKKILIGSNVWQNSDISRIHKPDQTTYEFTCTEYLNQNQNQINCKQDKKDQQKSTKIHNLLNLQGLKNQQYLKKLIQMKQTIKKLEFENKNLKSYNEVLTENLQIKKSRKFF